MNWETGPISPIIPSTPNGKGDSNQGPDRAGIPLVVDLIFGASTRHSLAFLIGAHSPGTPSSDLLEWVYIDALAWPTWTTRLNELIWSPSNDPPKRVYMGTHTTIMKGQGRAWKRAVWTCTKPTLGQNLAFFIWACSLGHTLTHLVWMTRPNELTQKPSNDPPERIYMGTHMTETKGQGRAR